jgi:murein DD-endopeptidase MepM/ murein hydrolase activator NlpD
VASDERAARTRLFFIPALASLALLALLAACAPPAPSPTLVPTAVVVQPGLSPTAAQPAAAGTGTPSAQDSSAAQGPQEPTAVVKTAGGDMPATATIPAGEPGIRPAEAQLQRPVELPPELAPPVNEDEKIEWRPPPVAVPHALHPDDHYWLIRPLPSGKRNYDLEWYPYGNRPQGQSNYRVHHGMDFPNSTGTPVFAAGSGTVVWAGPLRSNRDGVNYYGNTVVIHHDWQWRGEDVFTLYAHTLELFVEEGDTVQQGQLIAGVGASGEVSGPHLHLEVRVGENNYSSTRNPALWLAPYEGWGNLAGRFMDNRGRVIHGAQITVTPLEIDGGLDAPVRRQRTYPATGINPDDVWQENFVVADLPAGEYRIVMSTSGQTFRRTVRVQPGQTNYVIFQADFRWSPTATPLPTATPTPTVAPTVTATLEG